MIAKKALWKRVLALLLTACCSFLFTLLSPLVSHSQTPQNDMQGFWAQQCLETLVQQNIMSVFPDGTFRPNTTVTRAQFADILAKAFKNAPQVRALIDLPYSDIPEGYWAEMALRMTYEANFLSGYPSGIFAPLKPIPRYEVIVALASGLNYYAPVGVTNQVLRQKYNDAGAIPEYARDAIAAATEQKLIVNFPNVRQLQPRKLATKGEIAAFICQATSTRGLVPPQYIANIADSPVQLVGDRAAPIAKYLPYSPPKTITQTSPSSEIRGVWLTNIDSDVLFSPSRLNGAINRLRELNFNTLYPTVWNSGYTLYPSEVARGAIGTPLDPQSELQNRDILQEIVSQGHEQGMTVIPWFEFGFMAPANSALARVHPDWLTQKRNRDKIWLEGGVNERVWLNPLRPEVQQLITALLVEIVTKYNVDGIQLDDHFGYPVDFGYDSYTVNLYRQEHRGNSPPDRANNPEWIRWRANKITEFMKKLFKEIKKAKNATIISLSPNPQDYSLNAFLLDWQTWERLGLIEELIVQVYTPNLNDFRRTLGQRSIQQAKTHIPVAIGVLTGLKRRFVPFTQIETQVRTIRANNLAGVSFFFYESLWNYSNENQNQRQSNFQSLFPSWVRHRGLSSSFV